MLLFLMRFAMLAVTLLLVSAAASNAQWQMQDGHTTADLRGIDNVGGGVAWASGSDGTILRTGDAGFVWQLCAKPPGGEHLDFRAVQAFDNETAIVMSSGKGDLSRLYKTTDGCQTWKLVFTNPNPSGFFDALRMTDSHNGWLLGDPVAGRYVVAETNEGAMRFPDIKEPPLTWKVTGAPPKEDGGRGAFAASNSSLITRPVGPPENACLYWLAWFGTSGPNGAKVFRLESRQPQCSDWGSREWVGAGVPIAGSDASSGVFSLAARNDRIVVTVGGDYLKPNESAGTAAFSSDGGQHWTAASVPPHGYRSAVAYDEKAKTWITVGPNGTDISTDDGRNWRALKPDARFNNAGDADQHWNALSLPYVVGPHGRIGKLRESALQGGR